MDSVLNSIRKLNQVSDGDTSFDVDLILYINSALAKLAELGIGSSENCCITSDSETWADLFGENVDQTLIKKFVYLEVRLIFDPPNYSFVLDALKKELEEVSWRLYVKADNELLI